MSEPNLVLSLFPGIGLLDSAFEAEGWCVVRGPDVLWGGDVRRFLPPDFLADAPFTADGKLKAIANGVPLPMGRAIARAVREAMAQGVSP